MTRNRIRGIKYNRVSQQQKFILLHSILKDHYSIGEAAIKAKMHYSTAKAILFFYKHNQKTYFTHRVQGDNKIQPNSMVHASYVEKKNIKYPLKYEPISIISRVIINDLNDYTIQSQNRQVQDRRDKLHGNGRQRLMIFNNSENKTIKFQNKQAQIFNEKNRSIISIQSPSKIMQRKETQQYVLQDLMY